MLYLALAYIRTTENVCAYNALHTLNYTENSYLLSQNLAISLLNYWLLWNYIFAIIMKTTSTMD